MKKLTVVIVIIKMYNRDSAGTLDSICSGNEIRRADIEGELSMFE